MKKINRLFSVTIAFAVIMMTTGCDKYFEDAIVTPNDPAAVTPGLLLTSVQVSTFASYGGQLARQAGVMTQHVAGTSVGSQTVEIANYNITEITNENEWNGLYTGAVMNSKILSRDFGGANPWYNGISKVMLAMNIGLATDLWGDVPFSEAGQGETGNLSPAYDKQEEVIKEIQKTLDDAILALQMPEASNALFPGSDDLIFGGDADAWIRTAYALKARYANRLSEVNAGSSATEALAALANAYTSSAEDCNMIFGAGNSQNQWSAYEGSRAGYIRVSETFVDALFNTTDPRLAVLVGKDANDSISGTPFDDVDVTSTSYLSDYYASPSSSIPLVSYVEMKFIEAEAMLRAGNAGAADAHNDAVKASIMQITGAGDPTYEGPYASETAGSITLEKIMYQKWVALFAQVETYSDWRRTGFPTLTPNPNAVPAAGGMIPVRLPTPQNERLYNTNATVISNTITPVWWDK